MILRVLSLQVRVSGLVEATQMVYRLGGPSGFFRGLQARVLYQMPSAAICWSTYEFFKYLLTSKASPFTSPVEHHKAVIDGQQKSFEESALSTSVSRLSHVDASSRSLSSLSTSKTCELPIANTHHGVYNALTLSRIHPTDNVTTR